MDPKLRSALEKIERAQKLVNEAGEDLCSIEGYGDQWTEVCKLHDSVKATWHQVDDRREELRFNSRTRAQNITPQP